MPARAPIPQKPMQPNTPMPTLALLALFAACVFHVIIKGPL